MIPCKRGPCHERGQAMVEMVFVSITFLFCIMAIIQLALVLNAYALVRYAAYNSARAAIVHGGSQEKMDEAARVSLLAIFPRHGRADHVRGLTENYLAADYTHTMGLHTYYGEPITKTEIINIEDIGCGQVVTFDNPEQAARGVLTVQVVHQYELVLPLVNRIAFWIYGKFRSKEYYGGQTADYLAAETNRMRRTGAYRDIEYRIPLAAHYTMRLHSDYAAPACPTTTTTTVPTTTTTTVSTTTTNPCGVVNNPTINGYPLDHCYNYSKNCDSIPAGIYCQSLGCTGATNWVVGPAVAETWNLGDGTTCSSAKAGVNYLFCTPFTKIVCY